MNPVRSIGIWSSILSFVFAIGYCIPELLSTAGLLPHPHNLFWLFLPSLFLAPAFLVTMLCLHYQADGELKIWTAPGAAFAIIYCAFATLTYFVQLTVVVPVQVSGGPADGIDVLLFDRQTFLMAIDCLGYFFMSLSTFFAAFAFRRLVNKWLYRALLYNGLLMPILILAFFYPVLYYVGALWMISFPLAMVQAARLFRRNTASKLIMFK
ncbi:MAG: hypothetical protein ABW019_06715 [Chitinophagaceae bacterium]